MRPLQRARDVSLANLLDQSFLGRDVPVFSLQIVGRLASPDIQDLIDSLKKHFVAIGVEIAKQFGVRQKSAGTDPKNETSVQHVIEHGDAGRESGWMSVRHIDRAGSQSNLFSRRRYPGD